MSFTTLCLALALSGNTGGDVAHWPAKVLRGEVPTTGRAACLPSRTLELVRLGGELELDGWLGDGVLLLSDGGEKDARELLAQAERAREAVGGCSPAIPLPTRDAPLVVFHLRRAAFYRSVLDRLGALVPDSEELFASARETAGFELTEPQICVVSADGAPTNVRPNLLVHLVAHAFFDAGFGAAPEWLREGFALDVEARVCGEPEAFCRRGPHELARPGAKPGNEWTRRLAAEWDGADDSAFAGVFALAPDGYREAAAWRALALVRWLRERHAAKFAALANELTAAMGDALPDVSNVAPQGRALAAVLGPKWRTDFLAEVGGRKPVKGGSK